MTVTLMSNKFVLYNNQNKSVDTKKTGAFNIPPNYNKTITDLNKTDKLMNGVRQWAGYYREFPDEFVKDYLGISLKPFQKILLYCMMNNNYFAFFASRGLGKSFLTALYCVVRCILYPGTKIVVASGTKEQAMNLISEKIPELMQLSKTSNLKREIKGEIRTAMNSPDPNVEFINGSWIKAVASNQNARSKRANLLILDEFRMIDQNIYKNVLRRFLAVSRQPGYLDNEKYKHDKRYQERNQEIFLTSAYYKNNWSYTRFKIFVKNMLQGKKYFVCGLPYQFAIKEGLANREQLIDELQEDDIDVTGWEMEMNCMFVGESEKAYYKFDSLNNIRKLTRPLYNPNIYNEIKDKSLKYLKKVDGEIRLISCDIAVMGGTANDASIYSVVSLIPKNKNSYYKRNLLYMEAVNGMHTELQAIRIRQMMKDFEGDYIVIDTQSGGIGVFDQLVKKLIDRERGCEYEALSCINNEEMASRCLEGDAEKKIYSIKASGNFNSDISVKFKDDIDSGKVALLINELDAKEFIRNISGYDKLTEKMKVELLQPYLQTTFLVNEMINLSNISEDSGMVRLKEPRSGRKDRFSSVVYANYIANELEKDLIRESSYDSNEQLVFW